MKTTPLKASSYQSSKRLEGFPRYRELLSLHWKTLILLNLITIIGFLPFIAGTWLAILSKSVLVLIISCIVGGIFAGPALSGIFDAIFRILRDAPGKWTKNYKKAFKQNWKQSLFPGIVFCTLLGSFIFMAMLMWWAQKAPTTGTVCLFITCIILLFMLLPTYWAQLVLFNQKMYIRLRNCILFFMKYFFRVICAAAIQFLWWGIIILFLPWTSIVIILVGLWYVLFLTCFILYTPLNNAFQIEKQINEQFPEQIPEYGDDEWLKRKSDN